MARSVTTFAKCGQVPLMSLCQNMQLPWQRLSFRGYVKAVNIHEAVLQTREPVEGEEFRVLVIPGHTQVPTEKRERRVRKRVVPPPRYKSMKVDQDWTKVWPAAQTFKWSVIPFPVRQGMVDRTENDGIPPGKYANAELMKIPNFLHLSPPHIKKYCAALKEFCTPWPEVLKTDEDCERAFPVEVVSRDYCLDGPSIRDARARVVTLRAKLSCLELDAHARDKFLRLVGDRYNPETDIVTITADRCPLRKQNYDYAMYCLTAAYFESWKSEEWEADKTEADMEKFTWDMTQSKLTLLQTVRAMRQTLAQKEGCEVPKFVALLPEECIEEEIVQSAEVLQYKEAVTDLHDNGEDLHSLNKYKEAVANLLIPQHSSPL